MAKQIFEDAGLTTPAWEFIPARHVRSWRPSLPFPLVVKPNTGGSSLGVSIVSTQEELDACLNLPATAGQDLLAEVLIRGQELTCGMLVISASTVSRPSRSPSCRGSSRRI